MKSWTAPAVPDLPGVGQVPVLYDTVRASRETVVTVDGVARIYVCGVTPYDTTHMGHAATYVTFDLLHRALLDADVPVRYVQNVTDIDDPLLERAARDGVDWQDLAAEQTSLFTEDMAALRVVPPDAYVGVVESMEQIVAVLSSIRDAGLTYTVAEGGAVDTYLDLAQVIAPEDLSRSCHLDHDTMLTLSGERGGDPDRAGKRGPLDPMLWRGRREGEPSWEGGPLGPGRPGWHIECTAIAMHHLGEQVSVQAGGSDLAFPHHPMTAIQALAATGLESFAHHTSHQAMVGLDGEKMSKSKGNLVRVSDLRREGVDPMAVRLVLLDHHYRTEWSWTDEAMGVADERLRRWRSATERAAGPAVEETLAAVRLALADDLDSAAALRAVDRWCDAAGEDPAAPGAVADLVDALLGIRLHEDADEASQPSL